MVVAVVVDVFVVLAVVVVVFVEFVVALLEFPNNSSNTGGPGNSRRT